MATMAAILDFYLKDFSWFFNLQVIQMLPTKFREN